MDFWLPLLGGALGAALINGILALYKLKRDRQTEHDQWLRDAKLEAYVDFLKVVSPFNPERLQGVVDPEQFKALHLAIFSLQIVGGERVIEASKVTKLSVDRLFKHEIQANEAIETIYALAEAMKNEFADLRK